MVCEMKNGLLGGLLVLMLFQPAQANSADMTAHDLVEKVQQLMRSDTSKARYRMQIITPSWTRTIRMDAWDDRTQKRFFIRILSPRKDKDTTWLKDGGNLWMYLPKLERDIRIPPSMMLSNWMGSDFTNDDLVKMESVVTDYEHRILSVEDNIYTVESIPHSDAAVVWGKIVRHIRTDGIPIDEDFFDEHGKHVRHLAYDKVGEMDGRTLPLRWIVQADATPERQTRMILEEVKFNAHIDKHVFTRANMKRRGH